MPASQSASMASMPRAAWGPIIERLTSGEMAWMETFMGVSPQVMMRSMSSSVTFVSVTKLPWRNERR